VRVTATYRPGEVADLVGVSVDTVRRWCDEGRIGTARSVGGHRVIDGADLARFLDSQDDAFVPPALFGQSARNRLTGIVTKVERDTLVAIVHLQVGPHRIVSMMTREAADDLSLQPGDLAVAAVKSTNVVIEVPR